MLDKIYHTLFLSTPSARRATRCPLCERLRDLRFLSTPSARRATLFRVLGGKPYQNFYPRPPRGGRPSTQASCRRPTPFLSTPSARRATSCGILPTPLGSHFYPRPPRGGRRGHTRILLAQTDFYPRPPRGGRRATSPSSRSAKTFLSTPSARRATRGVHQAARPSTISIHALREEGDGAGVSVFLIPWLFLSTPSARRATTTPATSAPMALYFYPRPPRGGRRLRAVNKSGDPSFLSTPSARRATRGMRRGLPDLRNFYPRPPRGGRRDINGAKLPTLLFLSTPSARRATRMKTVSSTTPLRFLSTPSARRATSRKRACCWRRTYFYPRPPRGGRLQG